MPDSTRRPDRYKKQRRQEDPPAIAYLAQLYRQSPDYDGLSKNSQSIYDLYLFRLTEAMPWIRLSEIGERDSLRDFYRYRDTLAKKQVLEIEDRHGVKRKLRVGGKGAADMAMSVLSALLTWAVERGEIDVNLAYHVRTLSKSNTRSGIILGHSEEAEIMLNKNATADFKRLVIGALSTLLRVSDLCRAHESMLDKNGWLTITPQKTQRFGIRVEIPMFAYPPLKAIVDTMTGPFIFMNKKRPWTQSTVDDHWKNAVPTSAMHLHWHDLRGTGITRFLEAGCTDAEVSVVKGARLGSGTIPAYAARTRRLALNAYERLNNYVPSAEIIDLSATSAKVTS